MTAAHQALARQSSRRAGAPPCDPSTLGDVCAGGCGRRLHPRPPKYASRAACTEGHPVSDTDGRCYTCAVRERGGRGPRPKPVKRAGHRGKADPLTYCTHDEGEHCDCAGAAS